jgi:hypothetical protein
MASVEALEALGDIYDTDWAITGGLDRADPMKQEKSSARTILNFVAKGLPGSRSKPWQYDKEGNTPHFIYMLLHLCNVEHHSLEELKDIITSVHQEYDGIDLLTAERWGAFDLPVWCSEMDIRFEVVYPSYDKQLAAFTEWYIAVKTGRFKSPAVGVPGSKGENILIEEMGIFDHDKDARWFGSPEKKTPKGVQDDCMYSIAWNIYGGQVLSVDDFKPRHGKGNFGIFIDPRGRIIGNMQ